MRSSSSSVFASSARSGGPRGTRRRGSAARGPRCGRAGRSRRTRRTTSSARTCRARPTWAMSSKSPTHGWLDARSRTLRQQLVERLRPGDLLEQLHALVVFDALGCFIAATASPRAMNCCCERTGRVVEGRLDHRDHVERIGRSDAVPARRVGIEQLDRGERERRERLVEREVGLQVDGEPHDRRPPASGRAISTTPAVAQRAVDRERPAGELECRARGSWLSKTSERTFAEHVAAARDHVDEHRGGELQVRRERLRLGGDESLERALAPGHEPGGRLLAHDSSASWGRRPPCATARVLDLVFGRQHDDGARRVVAGAARPARDLVELAGAELPHPLPSYFASAVISTVRIGTLMPTPSVSVPQMTRSRPRWARVSTRRR